MSELVPGVASALSPMVRRIIAPNPGLMTGPGTNTYLVGIDEVAVIDPGPDVPAHIEAIVGSAGADRIRWILLTHTHPDHAPGAPRLQRATGAEILGFAKRDTAMPADRALRDGEAIDGTEFVLRAVHTPGHVPNHLCFLLEQERMLFTGDTVLEGTTSVISPRSGGDMAQYLASLHRLQRLRVARIAPGHGDVIDDPKAVLDEYVRHRRKREKQILTLVRAEPIRIPAIVARLYPDIDEGLRKMAGFQVYAHLRKLRTEGVVTGRDLASTWRLA
jgi:glyoxylase-like metal-dependent hydrolase (beta-lactamase superfamily II)